MALTLPTDLDPIFARHHGRIPVAFLRALAWRESENHTHLAMPGGPGAARGLLQIVGCVRVDYNRAHHTHHTAADLFDPDTNVAIAVWLIDQIVTAYGRHAITNLREDWDNPDFVELVLAGWNSGFSEGSGVGLVARYLERHAIAVTLDNVFKYAAWAGSSFQLQRTAKLVWQRQTAALYFGELARELERTLHAAAI